MQNVAGTKPLTPSRGKGGKRGENPLPPISPKRKKAPPRPKPRQGSLQRRPHDACRYLGIGGTLFDQLVSEGKLPKAKRLAGRVIWDRIALDLAFGDMPEDGRSGLDNMLDMARKRAKLRDRA